MFGELIGLWLAQAWLDLGRAGAVPSGRARSRARHADRRSAARDARACRAFTRRFRLHLVETSERLRAAQAERLAGVEASWHDALRRTCPAGPLFLVANEFFDALPVHQLVASERGWRSGGSALADGGRLAFASPRRPRRSAPRCRTARRAPWPRSARRARRWPGRSAARLAGDGGVALIVDYGAWADGPTGDTLQAVRGHAPCDPLEAPGAADLTTQVDFRRARRGGMRRRRRGLRSRAAGYVPAPLGIELRTREAARAGAPGQRRARCARRCRLTDASAMGELFKVLALAPPGGAGAARLRTPTLAAMLTAGQSRGAREASATASSRARAASARARSPR